MLKCESNPIVATSPPRSHWLTSSSASATPRASPVLPQEEENSQLNATREKLTTQHRKPPTDPHARRHHSRESSSAESRDYVDELASSAFQDCRTAALVLTAYSAQQLASYTDAISSTARDTSAGSPGMPRIHTFHRVDSDDDGGSEDRSFHEAETADDPSDAASGAVAEQDATIEAIVPVVDDGPAVFPYEADGEAQEVVRARQGTDAVSEDTSSNTPVGVWAARHKKERQSAGRPSIASSDLSIGDAKSAVAPSAACSSAVLRHAHSSEWAATRKTALERLRANFDHPSRTVASLAPERRSSSLFAQREPGKAHVLHSPSDAVISRDRALQPSDSFEDLSKAPLSGERAKQSETRDPSRAESKTAASILGALLGDSWIGDAAAVGQLSRSQKEPAAYGSLSEGESHASLSEKVATPVKQTAGSAATPMAIQSLSGSRFIVRPALSTDVSGISPIKKDVPSILADLYGTPDARPPAMAMLQTPPASLATTTPPPHARGRWSLQGALEAMHEPSADVATVGFHTAQTAPSAASASAEETDLCDRVTIDATATTEMSASACQHPPQSLCANRVDRAPLFGQWLVRSGVVLHPDDGGGAGSGLQADAKVPLSTESVPRSWDSSRVNRWRCSERQPLAHAEHSVTEASVATPAHENTALTRPAEWRQQRLKKELRAKEMAECTFQPLLSPGTRAMVRLAQERELERTLQEEEDGAEAQAAGTRPRSARTDSQQASLDPSTLKATLQSVYKRLYPAELSAAASRRQLLDQEMEYRRLTREELILLRHRCGVARRVPRSARSGGAARSRETFSSFMSTILQTDWEEATAAIAMPRLVAASSSPTQSRMTGSAVAPVAVLQTSYMSPMAVALLEEKKAKRKYHSRRQAEMHGQHAEAGDAEVGGGADRRGTARSPADSTEATRAEESFRVALFDEFLLRQNAYYFNRSRTVRELKQQMTPVFTPRTTNASARLVQNMVSRSLLNESLGPETSSIVAQRERQRVPFASLFVKQHASPYVDPCTFKPNISPSARALREEDRRRKGANKQAPAVQQQSFFERLYADEQRRAKQREEAKARAEAKEVEGLTFQPTLNVKYNARVHSTLNPRNYQPYQAYLLEKRQLLEAKRKEQAEEAQQAEEDVCTFRPQTTKKPAYIAKMAKCFGVLRQQDAEF
ncbi:conserved hypothetical protein [Leishmania major strain Friedlin]|uniref:Uncharacterized protein n=1 Tax=Leishmania major TaxID=5664 RepID=Q4Q5B4_LEIMA|nr:conserved hypothetical protein [Leishmania major strain Friedlin]CAG9580265.1 hypothetical_protein_-_conserved [Leishmania major strain Friedlin]CAJ08688.1 conserved hypothetical protein [Leishmania major strain Friedlin]|eukprot:XP_001685484.1 conserved hypothetical protein [Leishmania major strain Friedlin]